MSRTHENANMSEKCPVCNSDLSTPGESFHYSGPGIHGKIYSCQRCGEYHVEDFTLHQLKNLLNDDQKMAVLSHWIRTKHELKSRSKTPTETIILTGDLVDHILKQAAPKPAEQADKFVLWLGNSEHPRGKLISVGPSTHQSIMGSTTPEEFGLVLYHLMDVGILQGSKTNEIPPTWRARVALSFEGWERYEELKQGTVESRKAFMAMKYGEEALDELVENVLKPAVKQTGFDLSRLVDMPQPAGLIDDRLRVEIQASRFLIADLTHGNAGAYWEAGYAEGLGKPVIYLCEKRVFENPASRPHFDTNHHLTVLWDSEEPGSVAKSLKATIRATLPAEAKLRDDDVPGSE